MIIGNRFFETCKRPYIMGILNVTPDSFSDGGNYNDLDKALKHTKQMIDDGADIIDVGGESTRPGHTVISVQEEIERTCFVIEAIRENFNIPISIDTYKHKVAEAAILAGADLVNDIWGLTGDDMMAETVAKHGVSVCIMHNRDNKNYTNLMVDVVSDLKMMLDIADKAGIAKDRIMLDPGIGFAKTTEDNLIVMNNLKDIVDIGYPVLLGTSRKSMIGNTLNLPVEEREEGTIATSVIGLMSGVSFFRVHDVKANYRALKMTNEIMKAK
ncbi:MAG: dihydropteroate synthase [Lachnospiraceae bacterium]|nr:dihydropteroate synthase [Lachnospiraceae bacterium]